MGDTLEFFLRCFTSLLNASSYIIAIINAGMNDEQRAKCYQLI